MKSVFKGFEEIPPNFTVLVQLCRLLRDEYVALSQISALIEIDPGLAALVVRLSNSAYFGCQTPSSNLDEAINRIGFAEVLKLVALVSNRVLFDRPLTPYGMTSHDMWEQSLAAAIFMEFLSYDVDSDPGHAYLIGLLHAIGKYPIASLLQKVKAYAKADAEMDFISLAKWERNEVGSDRAKVGAQLLQKWGFAENVYTPIQFQLHPLLAPRDKQLACMLHITCHCVPCLLEPDDNPVSELNLPEGVLNACRLKRSEVEGYVAPALAWVKSTTNMVQGDLISA